MGKVRDWRDVRAEVLASGRITEDGVAEARRGHEDMIRSYRLRQIRESQAVRQTDLAKTMQVSQSRVSRIENGQLDSTGLGTLQRHVEALGGRLRLYVEFGDEQLNLA